MTTPFFPTEPKKIRERIKRYERELKKERETHWRYTDNRGARYLLGPLYLLANDLDGALAHFAWFEKEFPDDAGEALHFICWTLALRRAGKKKPAEKKFIETMSQSPHAWRLLTGEKFEFLDEQDPLEAVQVNELARGLEETIHLWEREELQWAHDQLHSPAARKERTRIVREERELRKKWETRKQELEKKKKVAGKKTKDRKPHLKLIK